MPAPTPIFTPGHTAVLYCGLEDTPITESWDFAMPASLSDPTLIVPDLIGQIDVPEVPLDEGNRKGYGGGAAQALHDAKGDRIVSLAVRVRPAVPASDDGAASGSILFLQRCLRNAADANAYGMVDLALFSGATGGSGWMDVVRFANCNQLGFNFQENQEVAVQLQFEGIALDSNMIRNPTADDLRALGAVLLWHNLQFTIGGTDYRCAIAGANVTLSQNLGREGSRLDWGDNHLLSRTSLSLVPHHTAVTGELTFHQRLQPELVNQAVDSSHWGDAVMACTDAPYFADGGTPHAFTVTLVNVRPVRQTQRGGEVSQSISRTVPIVADDLLITVPVPSGGSGGG